MNLQKGLNRIFILLGLVAAGFGLNFGGNYAARQMKPSAQEAFQSINWNDQKNINKYYLTAKNQEKYDTIRENQKPTSFADMLPIRTVFTEDLPNYKKSPPQYNAYVFKKTFPNALKTPVYTVLFGLILGALFAFCLCYGGLHLIRLVIKWIISGFK